MVQTTFKRATVGGRVEQFADARSAGELALDGLTTELSYLAPDAQAAALQLEAELIADAQAGVDLRIRLIGRACSAEEI